MMTDSITLLLFFLVLGLTAWVAWLGTSYQKLKRRIEELTNGQGGASLEENIKTILDKSASIERVLGAHKEAFEVINARLSGSIRGFSLVRFNAFQASGSPQSFAAGFLNEEGAGFILSVLVNRNHVGVYAKPVENFKSLNQLTEEETQALLEAREKLSYE